MTIDAFGATEPSADGASTHSDSVSPPGTAHISAHTRRSLKSPIFPWRRPTNLSSHSRATSRVQPDQNCDTRHHRAEHPPYSMSTDPYPPGSETQKMMPHADYYTPQLSSSMQPSYGPSYYHPCGLEASPIPPDPKIFYPKFNGYQIPTGNTYFGLPYDNQAQASPQFGMFDGITHGPVMAQQDSPILTCAPLDQSIYAERSHQPPSGFPSTFPDLSQFRMESTCSLQDADSFGSSLHLGVRGEQRNIGGGYASSNASIHVISDPIAESGHADRTQQHTRHVRNYSRPYDNHHGFDPTTFMKQTLFQPHLPPHQPVNPHAHPSLTQLFNPMAPNIIMTPTYNFDPCYNFNQEHFAMPFYNLDSISDISLRNSFDQTPEAWR